MSIDSFYIHGYVVFHRDKVVPACTDVFHVLRAMFHSILTGFCFHVLFGNVLENVFSKRCLVQ